MVPLQGEARIVLTRLLPSKTIAFKKLRSPYLLYKMELYIIIAWKDRMKKLFLSLIPLMVSANLFCAETTMGDLKKNIDVAYNDSFNGYYKTIRNYEKIGSVLAE